MIGAWLAAPESKNGALTISPPSASKAVLNSLSQLSAKLRLFSLAAALMRLKPLAK